jgi:hypothetical protein
MEYFASLHAFRATVRGERMKKRDFFASLTVLHEKPA